MIKKISEETQQKIEELYAQGLSRLEIAKQTSLPYCFILKYAENLKRGFISVSNYMDYLANQRGLSVKEYRKQLKFQKRQNSISRMLSKTLKEQLEVLGKDEEWLAERLEEHYSIVSDYLSGNRIPERDSQERIFSILKLPYKNLSDLVIDEMVQIITHPK